MSKHIFYFEFKERKFVTEISVHNECMVGLSDLRHVPYKLPLMADRIFNLTTRRVMKDRYDSTNRELSMIDISSCFGSGWLIELDSMVEQVEKLYGKITIPEQQSVGRLLRGIAADEKVEVKPMTAMEALEKRNKESVYDYQSYDPTSRTEDFIFPNPGTGRGSKVETLPQTSGAELLADLEYFNNQIKEAMMIPKEYIGKTLSTTELSNEVLEATKTRSPDAMPPLTELIEESKFDPEFESGCVDCDKELPMSEMYYNEEQGEHRCEKCHHIKQYERSMKIV